MKTLFGDPGIWLPQPVAALIGRAIRVHVMLDGYDLGVRLLFSFAEPAPRDRFLASTGPFWNANETWLVLAVGLLPVAFPLAHGAILTALYLPVAIMRIGLILRRMSFEFRMKAPAPHKWARNTACEKGALMSAALPVGLFMALRRLPTTDVSFAWRPFAATLGLVALAYPVFRGKATDLRHDAACDPEPSVAPQVSCTRNLVWYRLTPKLWPGGMP